MNLKDMSWTMNAKITEAIQSWEEPGKKSNKKDRRSIIPASIWWAIWKEYNSRAFDSM